MKAELKRLHDAIQEARYDYEDYGVDSDCITMAQLDFECALRKACIRKMTALIKKQKQEIYDLKIQSL